MSIFTDDSVKTIKVLNGSTDITEYVKSDSFSVENILCDGQLAFGTCNSARAQMTTITDLNLTGATITVQYGYGTTFENIGVYKVTYSSQTENSDEVVVTMYDCVKDFDVDVSEWYENLSFPMSLATFRTALCTYIGVTAETVSLVNDDMTIYKTIAPSQLNGKDVLRYIGEINGVFPHATRSGTFTWLSLGTVATAVPASLVQGADGVVQKDYTTASIGALVIRTEDGDVGVTVGSGTNTYYVTANVLCYGLTTAQLTPIATNLYNKIYAVQYVPTSISMKCIPTYEMGALLSYGGNHFYILEKKTSGLMFDDISCEGNEYLSEPSSIQTQLEQLRGKSAVLSASIEGVSSRVTDIEEDYTTYTEFSQTADSLTLAISDLQNEIDGSIEIIYTDGEPTLTNYPAWDWTDMRAFDSDQEATAAGDVAWKASDELQFLYNDDGYDPHRRTMVYDQTNSVTYRFVQNSGQWVWQVLENTEFSVVLEKISALELTTDGITAEVSAVEADLEDNYFNKSETNSLVSQTSSSILASVSGTYATKATTNELSASLELKLNKDDLVSEFNAVANVVTITSDNFTLDADGHITANGATLNGSLLTTATTRSAFGGSDEIGGANVDSESNVTFTRITWGVGGGFPYSKLSAGGLYQGMKSSAGTYTDHLRIYMGKFYFDNVELMRLVDDQVWLQKKLAVEGEAYIDDNLYVSGAIRATDNLATNIVHNGREFSTPSLNLPSGEPKGYASLQVHEGIPTLINVKVTFSASTGGYRRVYLSDSLTNYTPIDAFSEVCVGPALGADTVVELNRFIVPSSTDSLYVIVQQASGSTLTAQISYQVMELGKY
jgi:hypothetical protein